MKLSYWIAEVKNDSACYNLRAKTKKEVVALLNSSAYNASDFEAPKKVEVEYSSAFDLMEICMNEGHGYWEVV